MALNNLNNPFSPQPNSNLDMSDAGMVTGAGHGQYSTQVVSGPVAVVGGVQYTAGTNMEQDRSRHSSAGSDGNQCHAR